MDARIAERPPGRAMIAPPPTSAAAIHAARPEVFQLLMRTPAFRPARGGAAQDRRSTVRVLSYMTDPNGVHSEIAAREASGDLSRSGALAASPVGQPAPVARVMGDDPVEATKRQLSQSPGFAGQDFEAAAVRQGVEQFGEMVRKVDFPEVRGRPDQERIPGDRRKLDRADARLWRAYRQRRQDDRPVHARQYRRGRWPRLSRRCLSRRAFGRHRQYRVMISRTGRKPRSRLRGWRQTAQNAAVRLAEISREMNVNPPVTDLSDANAELRLVTAARLQMAKSRQQLRPPW